MILGIDIGGTTIKYAHVDTDLTILKEWTIDTFETKSSDIFYDLLVEHMYDLNDVSEIAVSAPGVIADDSTISSIAAPRVSVMFQTNCNKEINKRTNLRVTTINDAKAAGYAEYVNGAAMNTESSVAFIIGTGVGGGVVYKGDVINGIDGYAAEFSRIPVITQDGSVKIAAELCAATSLVSFYNKASSNSLTRAKEVFDRYYDNDPIAIDSMNQWTHYIAVVLLQLIFILNPDVICIGGGVMQDENLLGWIQEAFDRFKPLYTQPMLSTKLVKTKHATNSNLLGAVMRAQETH